MIIEWKGILIILGILLVYMLIIKAFEKKLKPESRRKAFHMGMGVVMLTLPSSIRVPFTLPFAGFPSASVMES